MILAESVVFLYNDIFTSETSRTGTIPVPYRNHTVQEHLYKYIPYIFTYVRTSFRSYSKLRTIINNMYVHIYEGMYVCMNIVLLWYTQQLKITVKFLLYLALAEWHVLKLLLN